LTAREQRKQHRRFADFNRDQKSRESFAIMQPDADQGLNTGKQIIRHGDFEFEPGQIVPSDQAGNRHETEQRRVYQIDQIITGIDRGKTEQQGDPDIETTGSG
jgi:hypothetical protein